MNSDFLNNASLTKTHAKISIYIGIGLLALSILILILGISLLEIKLTGDNLVYIISGLFISGLSLILFPMYFQNNIEKVEIQNGINLKLDDDDEKILYEIKESLEKEIENIKEKGFGINNFQIENNDENRYLLKKQGSYARSKRFIVGYNIPTKVYYIIKKNILDEYSFKSDNKFEDNFVNFKTEKYPDFNFGKKILSTEDKIKEIINILNKLEKKTK